MKGWPTPIADAALARASYVPPRVDEWLRGMEMRVRSLHARLGEAAKHGDPLPPLQAVLASAEQFLEEDGPASMPRLVRRPLRQLVLHGASAAAYDAFVRRLLERGQRAIELQAEAEALAAEVDRVRGRFTGTLPYHVAGALSRARVGPDAVRAARRPADLRPLRRRLERAERALEELGALVPPHCGTERFPDADGPSVTAGELLAALALRRAQRDAARVVGPADDSLRRLAARHVAELAGQGGGALARHDAHLLAERLALKSLRPAESAAPGGEDVEVWGGLLAAAGRALHGGSGDAWRPRVSSGDEAEHGRVGAEDVVFAVAIDERHVWLAAGDVSPVRVWSREIRLGREVECRALSAGGLETTGSALLDVAPLFDGLDPDEPGWYAVERAATLRVLAREGSGWLARLECRGRLRRLRVPVWRSGGSSDAVLRVLAPETGAAGSPVTVEPFSSPPVEFLGWRTREVHTPFATHPVGWVREASGDDGDQALWREHALFAALAARTARAGLTPLGRACLSRRGGAALPLYGRPFALRRSEAPPLKTWFEAEDRAGFVRAVARVAGAVHDAGYALGVYHPDAFAYSVRWRTETGAPHPRAWLVEAPCAAAFGECFQAPHHAHTNEPEYLRLRFRGLPPVVRVGETASAAADMLGFGLLVLDLLATRPLPLPRAGWLSWDDIPSAVEKHAEGCFVRPRLARDIAACLESVTHAGTLLPLFHKLAFDDPDTPELSSE